MIPWMQRNPNLPAPELLAPGWKTRLGDEFEKPYMQSLGTFLANEIESGVTILPPPDRIFRALRLVDFDAVRVVILGQDPYPGVRHANGLAFAVDEGIAPPPSLKNIFREIEADVGVRPKSVSLVGWANQGVLLLNTVLTVRAQDPMSHRGQGWETFTRRVLSELNTHRDPIVFLLWGNPAQKTAIPLITAGHHHILTAAHPSPLSAHRGFLGCRHFSKANAILSALAGPVDWANS